MKELHTGNMYWPTTLPTPKEYPSLSTSIEVDVLVIGGGVSGIVCAHTLASSGIEVTLIEQHRISTGSTAANTGLLQYSNDIMLCDLKDKIGEQSAELFYRSCKSALNQLATIAHNLPVDVGFKQRSSLYYASTEQDLPKLKREYEALLKCGFEVEYWEPEHIREHFPFCKEGAIVTHGDAEVNPFQFVHGLALDIVRQGGQLYEETSVEEHTTLQDGKHTLLTSDGYTITANQVIYAIGYEPEELRGKLIKASLNRSFVIVTNIQNNLQDWHHRYMLWETARPYLYLRTTADGRIIVGGLDEEKNHLLHGDKAAKVYSEKLLAQLKVLFPDIQPRVEYQWNATFGESQDDLPFIGEDPEWNGVYYSLGYGGNGTVYSMMAASIIHDLILEKTGKPLTETQRSLANIVALNRTSLLD